MPKETIIFWSGPYKDGGTVPNMEFSDNSLALFYHMLQKKINEHYLLVWLVSNPARYTAQFDNVKNVRFLLVGATNFGDKHLCDEYLTALNEAKYIFTTDGYGFADRTRTKAIRVQLWHGCGIKTRVHFGRMEHNYEFMTVSSEFYKKRHAEIFGLRDEQVIVTGLPKNDLLFTPKKNWQERLNIPYRKKYIFWLPTFRTTNLSNMEHLNEQIDITSETGLPVVNRLAQVERLEKILAAHDMGLIIKLHPFQKRDNIFLQSGRYIHLLENEALADNFWQIENILGDADALISDYSSVAVSYCILNRPLAFTLDDCAEYDKHRGFHWDNVRDFLPGTEISSFNDFERFVEDVATGNDMGHVKRERLLPIFHKYCDDGSSARILEYFDIT